MPLLSKLDPNQPIGLAHYPGSVKCEVPNFGLYGHFRQCNIIKHCCEKSVNYIAKLSWVGLEFVRMLKHSGDSRSLADKSDTEVADPLRNANPEG